MNKTTFTIEGFEMLEKVVPKDAASYSSRIYVPQKWQGKKIAIVRLE